MKDTILAEVDMLVVGLVGFLECLEGLFYQAFVHGCF
jgi:hypothetical protein